MEKVIKFRVVNDNGVVEFTPVNKKNKKKYKKVLNYKPDKIDISDELLKDMGFVEVFNSEKSKCECDKTTLKDNGFVNEIPYKVNPINKYDSLIKELIKTGLTLNKAVESFKKNFKEPI